MRTPRKNLGALQEVAEFFDTAPAAFHAEWAPDSRHLALWYRVHRHLNRLAITESRTTALTPSTGQSLLLRVSPELALAEPKIDVAFHYLKWQSSHSLLASRRRNYPARHYANFCAQSATLANSIPYRPTGRVPSANYAIDAICELATDDRYRIHDDRAGI